MTRNSAARQDVYTRVTDKIVAKSRECPAGLRCTLFEYGGCGQIIAVDDAEDLVRGLPTSTARISSTCCSLTAAGSLVICGQFAPLSTLPIG